LGSTWWSQAAADISDYLEANRLNSLHWVSGTNTISLATLVIEILANMIGTSPDNDSDFHALVGLEEKHLIEGPLRKAGWSIGMLDEDCTDSFLVINRAAVLDVTELSLEGLVPKLNGDATVVSLQMVLFSILEDKAKYD